jgi:hypothetical protein
MSEEPDVEHGWFEPLQPKYPESDKLAAVGDQRRAITEFIEWAGNRLGRESLDDLIMEFFNIDIDKLESERRTMLEGLG